MSISDNGEQRRTQAEEDAFWAWICASNCVLYECPALLNIGSETEPAWVSRSYAWCDAYAHHLISKVDADHARLLAAAHVCRAQLAETRTLRNMLAVFARRWGSGAPKPWQPSPALHWAHSPP